MDRITEEIKQFVNRVKLGFVATVGPDGSPNLSPKGTTIAWDEEHLAFADIHSPGTVKNLFVNPAVEVNVVDIFSRRGYRFKGFAKVLSKGEVFESILLHYRNAGSKHNINNIVLVKVQQVIPVFSPAYDNDLTEEEITNKWIEYWNLIHKKV